MKKTASLLVLILLFTAFKSEDLFVGKIIYKSTFTDLKGNDITSTMAPLMGMEQHYFIDGKNYKALDENNNYVQLYNSGDNTYYFFMKDKTAQKVDASTPSSKKVKVTKLDAKEKIAGYDTKAVKIETDNATTVFYFSPLVKTNAKKFEKHTFGEFNKFMEASGGALPLKFVVTDTKNGYIWTSVATAVTKMKLSQKDFDFPEGYQIKNQ